MTIDVKKLNVVKRIDAKRLAAYEEKGFVKVESAENKAVKEKSISQMNTAELEAKAAEVGVDISGAKNNPERAKIITDFITRQEQDNE